MAFQKETLVIGNGLCADQVADRLDARGIVVRRALLGGADGAARGAGATADLSREGVELVDCRGQAGHFRVTLAENDQCFTHTVSGIVLAQPWVRIPNHDLYGLPPSDRVTSIAALEAAAMESPVASMLPPGAKVVFLNSWRIDPHPVMTQSMLQYCLTMQRQSDANTFFLCGNLKVAADGMEACCDEARTAGTVFVKFTRRFPVMTPLADGRIQVDYWDETTGMDCRLQADLVVVDERVTPHPGLAQAIKRLRLEGDPYGFAQGDNVHRLPNLTNRRGIFVAGGARAVLPAAALVADAEQVALQVLAFLSDADRAPLPHLEIDQDSCARCLTCYRLCPYAAIEMTPHMQIHPAACQGCGLCVAGCPNRAIQIADDALEKALGSLTEQGRATGQIDGFVPKIVAFCCSRSAVPARASAIAMGHRLPPKLVCVEGICGGAFSVRHLLGVIEAGMDGVLVLTCHEGNCHSEQGTLEARKRVAEALRLLSWAGVAKERVRYATLAANMSSEFVRMANDFAEKIKALGPAISCVST